MKQLAVFAAVVLVCQAAKVPSEVIHQVVVPVPNGVVTVQLSTPPPSNVTSTNETTPAQVVQVGKDQVHASQIKEKIMTTMQPETKTITEVNTMVTPAVATNDTKRKTRAVPFKDTEPNKTHRMPHNHMNAMKTMWADKKQMMLNKKSPHRSMRSVETTAQVPVTVQPVTVTKNLTVKSIDSTTTTITTVAPTKSSSIDPCDLLCTKFEFEPICATNGLCLHEFPNQCILETYNCKHPSGKFSATKDGSCQMDWHTNCNENEMI